MSEGILSPGEAESLIQKLKVTSLEDIGSHSWIKKMINISKLNAQAALEAASGLVEEVKDFFIEKNKLGPIVEDLLLIEIWKSNVLTILPQKKQQDMTVYIILFSGGILCNILETCLFDKLAIQSIGDYAISLVDFTVRQLINFISKRETEKIPKSVQDSDDIETHYEFDVSMKSISILRFLTEHLEDICLGVASRLTIVHDVPAMLVNLLEIKPWIEKSNGTLMKFNGQNWRVLDPERQSMRGPEVQVWICLMNVLHKPLTAEKYEINNYRRNMLTKLIPLITDEMKNELSGLDRLYDWLVRLDAGSHGIGKTGKNSLILESIDEGRENLIKKYSSKEYLAIRNEYLERIAEEGIFELFAEWLELSSNQKVRLMENTDCSKPNFNCGQCFKPDCSSICSGCSAVRYCGRDCQAKHWKSHKKLCRQKNKTEEPKIQTL